MPTSVAAKRILVCVNQRLSPAQPSCGGRGSLALLGALERAAAARGIRVEIATRHCFGRCHEGPNVRFFPGGRFFRGVGPQDADAVVEAFADWLLDG